MAPGDRSVAFKDRWSKENYKHMPNDRLCAIGFTADDIHANSTTSTAARIGSDPPDPVCKNDLGGGAFLAGGAFMNRP